MALLSPEHISELRSRLVGCLYRTYEDLGSKWEDDTTESMEIFDTMIQEYKEMRLTLQAYDAMVHELLAANQSGDGTQMHAKAVEVKNRLIKLLAG